MPQRYEHWLSHCRIDNRSPAPSNEELAFTLTRAAESGADVSKNRQILTELWRSARIPMVAAALGKLSGDAGTPSRAGTGDTLPSRPTMPAMKRRRDTGWSPNDMITSLLLGRASRRCRIYDEAAKLISAIAAGGDVEDLVGAIKVRKADITRIEDAWQFRKPPTKPLRLTRRSAPRMCGGAL